MTIGLSPATTNSPNNDYHLESQIVPSVLREATGVDLGLRRGVGSGSRSEDEIT